MDREAADIVKQIREHFERFLWTSNADAEWLLSQLSASEERVRELEDEIKALQVNKAIDLSVAALDEFGCAPRSSSRQGATEMMDARIQAAIADHIEQRCNHKGACVKAVIPEVARVLAEIAEQEKMKCIYQQAAAQDSHTHAVWSGSSCTAGIIKQAILTAVGIDKI